MYTRLAFAVAANLESEILVVDEVLAVGDAEFQKKCLAKMKEVSKQGRTVLFVSHNMTAISDLCNESILLEKGQIRFRGGIADAINIYLQESTRWEAEFEGEAVNFASVRQKDQEIEINIRYKVSKPLDLPCLGFTISDHMGAPVCGNNPKDDKVPLLDKPRTEGVVKLIIRQPKLLNGTYRLSLWFGDGKEDFFIQRDCLSFDIIGMSTNQHTRTALNGSCYPECEWVFD
jgi:lipopolysaccharide transport system ATP-binding protein